MEIVGITHQWNVSLETENTPKFGYHSIASATKNMMDYVFRHYNPVRHYRHNLGLSPKAKEDFYWQTSIGLANKSCPL